MWSDLGITPRVASESKYGYGSTERHGTDSRADVRRDNRSVRYADVVQLWRYFMTGKIRTILTRMLTS